jgi:hypothetical protein
VPQTDSIPQQSNLDALAVRIAHVEADISLLQSSTTTATNTTTTTATSSSSGLAFYPVAETALGLTQDGAWHDGYVAPGVIPADAKYLQIAIQTNITAAPGAPQLFKVTKDTTHATFYTATYLSWHVGANGIISQVGNCLIPVGQIFSYYIDNDPNWTLTATVQGYWK